jgi:hypothetical protein
MAQGVGPEFKLQYSKENLNIQNKEKFFLALGAV